MSGTAHSWLGLPGSRVLGQSIAELLGLGIAGVKLQSSCHRLACFGVMRFDCQFRSQVDPGFDPGRSGVDSHLEVLDSPVGIAGAGKQIAELSLRCCQAWIELDGLLKLGAFALQIAGFVES